MLTSHWTRRFPTTTMRLGEFRPPGTLTCKVSILFTYSLHMGICTKLGGLLLLVVHVTARVLLTLPHAVALDRVRRLPTMLFSNARSEGYQTLNHVRCRGQAVLVHVQLEAGLYRGLWQRRLRLEDEPKSSHIVDCWSRRASRNFPLMMRGEIDGRCDGLLMRKGFFVKGTQRALGVLSNAGDRRGNGESR